MPLAWLHDYLERRRIRRNGNRRVLDERFGDPDITAPMAGGWNQLPVVQTTSAKQVLMGAEQESNGKGSNIWMKCCFCDREDEKDILCSNPQLSSTPTEKEGCTPNPSARNSGGAGFVYKPASEEFFKEMAGIGKSKSSPTMPNSNDSEKHRKTEKTPLEPVNERHHTPVQVPVPVQPTVPTKSKNNRKNKRAVTEELVPSDEDLFG
ncbi:predicted protein [Histoplasma mississippiense (nom. inval.)]|uniref:predicted protein n=1 Tax=Ajellomyces capsulatus (strain NAm1 / WU24) TaxID=2059318 RepID=UPI000157CDF8|nr:predicted protein [Histoplasma mississippiense (nom. inval.)]EDN10420.1 predicted protein [Histoplasma mississippiense (nom. inval.)]